MLPTFVFYIPEDVHIGGRNMQELIVYLISYQYTCIFVGTSNMWIQISLIL
jgi:hypothetical protein